MEKTIIITGIGVISSLGFSKENYWENRKSKKINASKVTSFSTDNLKAGKAYSISDFRPKEFIKRRMIKPLDEVTRYCVASSGEAIKDAGLDDIDRSKLGLVAGSKYHGIFSIFNIKETYHKGGLDEVSPIYFPGTVFNASGSQAAIEWGLTGPNCTVNTGMTSGLTAVIKGAEYLLLNKADAMICGGNEMLFDFIMSKYDRLDLLSSGNNEKEQCRPFDDKRNGIMLGEGACYFTLESKSREAEPLAEMINYSYNFDPDKNSTIDAFIECMKESLHVNGEDYTNKIDLVVADGSGDLEMDMLIASAISKTFSHNPYVTSNKGCIGHTLGASGAFNLLDGILCLQNQALLPIQNLLDPVLPLNFVTEYREAVINNVLVTSVDSDGNNACVLLKKA